MIGIFLLWIASNGLEDNYPGLSNWISLLGLIPFIMMWVLVSKETKRVTGSAWSPYVGALSVYFFGLGGYFGLKEFYKNKKIGLAGKILSVIAIIIVVSFFLFGFFYA